MLTAIVVNQIVSSESFSCMKNTVKPFSFQELLFKTTMLCLNIRVLLEGSNLPKLLCDIIFCKKPSDIMCEKLADIIVTDDNPFC